MKGRPSYDFRAKENDWSFFYRVKSRLDIYTYYIYLPSQVERGMEKMHPLTQVSTSGKIRDAPSICLRTHMRLIPELSRLWLGLPYEMSGLVLTL